MVHQSIRVLNISFVAELFMDLIHFLLSVLIGLFPKLLQFSPAQQPMSSARRRQQKSRMAGRHKREFIVGHRRIGWYCLSVEVYPDDWLRYRVVGISTWNVTFKPPITKVSNLDQTKSKLPDRLDGKSSEQ